jgi:predicted aldo/keto reductase-like oxidoreductase
MNCDFTHTTLGKTAIPLHRLGLSATYRPGKKTIYCALDEGLNYFFAFGIDGQMIKVLREMQRDKYVLATGAYNYIWRRQNLRSALEKRLWQFRTDYLDVFLFLGVLKEKEFPESVREEMCRLREEGKVRAIGISTHNRNLAARLVADGALDTIMMRYNAAHRGAEQEIFPHLSQHHPGVISYTATRWTYLLRRPPGWPKEARLPTAGMCYRFVLSNPNVNVCLTAPNNLKQFEENLNEVRRGPLGEVDMEFMRQFGDAVHAQNKWFM